MPIKDMDKIKDSLIEIGQAYMFRESDLKENKPLALVKIKSNEDDELEILIHRCLQTFSRNEAEQDNLALIFVNRGYQYVVFVEVEAVDDLYMIVKDFVKCIKTRIRRYFRIAVTIDFTVQTLGISGKSASFEDILPEMKSNISGGGFFFYAGQELSKGKKVVMILDLEDCGIVQTHAVVVRCKLIDKKDEIYGIAVEFAGITEQERERILNFISGVQRRQIEMGSYQETYQRH